MLGFSQSLGSVFTSAAAEVDFLSEFDPFADTDQRTTPSAEGFAELSLGLFAFFFCWCKAMCHHVGVSKKRGKTTQNGWFSL